MSSLLNAAVEIAIAEGFQEMISGNALLACKVCDGAGDLQDAVIGACTEIEIRHRALEKLVAGIIETAMLFELSMTHPGIARGFATLGKTRSLERSRLENALPDGG